jgi:hypothetical protein
MLSRRLPKLLFDLLSEIIEFKLHAVFEGEREREVLLTIANCLNVLLITSINLRNTIQRARCVCVKHAAIAASF